MKRPGAIEAGDAACKPQARTGHQDEARGGGGLAASSRPAPSYPELSGTLVRDVGGVFPAWHIRKGDLISIDGGNKMRITAAVPGMHGCVLVRTVKA